MIFNFLIVFHAMGQPYHKLLGNHQTWEQYQGDATSFCVLQAGQVIFEGNDTIIQGNIYKILLNKNLYSNTPNCFTFPFYVNDTSTFIAALMREDTILKKVYIYDSSNNIENVIYDFGLSAGDTLFNPFNDFITTSAIWTIDSVSQINISGIGLRNCFYVHIDGSAGDFYYIEGIGGIFGINQSGFEANNSVKELECVKDSNSNTFFGNCFSNVGLENHNKFEKSKIEYNNINHELKIICGFNNETFTINIINSLGQYIYKDNKANCGKNYNLGSQDAGVYFYTIMQKKLVVSIGKILIY